MFHFFMLSAIILGGGELGLASEPVVIEVARPRLYQVQAKVVIVRSLDLEQIPQSADQMVKYAHTMNNTEKLWNSLFDQLALLDLMQNEAKQGTDLIDLRLTWRETENLNFEGIFRNF